MLNLGFVWFVTMVTVIFPSWVRAFDAWACSLLSRWFVAATLAVATVGVYCRVWREGCRNGWWAVLWSVVVDWHRSY